MIKKYWILTLVLTLICHNAHSKNDIFITASVNGEILTNLDVHQEIEYLKILNPELNELNNKKIFNIAKKSLINEKIKKKELENFFVFDEEVPLINQIFEDFYKNLGFSNEKEFENILSQKKTFSIISS